MYIPWIQNKFLTKDDSYDKRKNESYNQGLYNIERKHKLSYNIAIFKKGRQINIIILRCQNIEIVL